MNGAERRGRRDMVQPGGGGGAGPGPAEAGGAAGEEAAAAAAGRGPAELGGSPEVLQRLLEENRELKGALSRCSACLRLRLEELRRLQGQRRGEWQLLWGRWGQARALVERLRRERDEAARWHRGDSDGASVTSPGDAGDTDVTSPGQRGDVGDADVTSPGDVQSPKVTAQEEVTAEVTAEVTTEAPPEPSPTEQLRQRLAAAEAELVTAREARAAAERRAQDVSQRAELQLQALRRQLEQDKAQVQAQVTSLLGELRESQSRLERSRRERDELEQRARVAGERCSALEELSKGHGLQLDQLRLQVHNLETALRVERHAASDEKRKLVQLQVAYHHLFQEYDAHIKASAGGDTQKQELGQALSRLAAAEEALAAKQELIDKLKSEAERQRATLDTIPVLQAQAEIYRADFEAERAAREQLHAQREALQGALRSLRLRLDAEGAQRLRMEELRTRHSLPGPVFGGPRAPQSEEEPELCCPKCQYRAPDMDTLQIHVTECIE